MMQDGIALSLIDEDAAPTVEPTIMAKVGAHRQTLLEGASLYNRQVDALNTAFFAWLGARQLGEGDTGDRARYRRRIRRIRKTLEDMVASIDEIVATIDEEDTDGDTD